MRILITGGTGYVGETLIPYLLSSGFTDITLLIRNMDKAQSIFKDYTISYISTQNKDWSYQVIKYSPDIVLHMATLFTGKSDAESAKEIINTNVLFTTLLLEALSHTNCNHFVNIGTFTEYLYGDGKFFPNNLYSASKTAVRPIIQYYQTLSTWKWTNIIVYSPYGKKNKNKKVLDYLLDALNSPTPIKFSGGEQVLDFIHVDDIADFFATLFTKMYKNEWNYDFIELHLGSGYGHSIKEIAKIMEKFSGKKVNAIWGALPYRKLDTMHAVAPIEKNLEYLNWKSKIDIVKGINKLIQQI
ncbi:NAD-dependent epimerase/dehydratase family protein [Phocaeicola plebeius]|jgi:CDP-paratose synthetase|uniref:NAD-dependent epimerase/dehydratase family protein n=1 Tax=Phocaeicola plebeius TaxID=310297 RepID=UPI0035622293